MTPDNAIYYHLAYIIAGIVYGTYAISLVVRRRPLEQKLDKL
jgi:hypothetical protein